MKYSDEAYTMIERNRELNTHGSRKKSGSKSKKCTLPSDNLTKKQREALNSEVREYNLNTLYNFYQFKDLPDDIKVEWVNHIKDKYKVSLRSISKIVLGRTSSYLSTYFYKVGLIKLIDKTVYKNKDADKVLEEDVKFQASCKGLPFEEDLISKDTHESTATETKKSVSTSPVKKIEVSLDELDINTINQIYSMFVGQKVRCKLTVEVINDYENLQ